MKIEVNEYDNTFDIDLEPETLAEAALLVRLGMNANAKASVHTYAFSKSGICSSVIVSKRKRGRIAV